MTMCENFQLAPTGARAQLRALMEPEHQRTGVNVKKLN